MRRFGLLLVLIGLALSPSTLAQECSAELYSFIDWPRHQCTQPCPAGHPECTSSIPVGVMAGGASYCCACLQSQTWGSFEAKLCPYTAQPPATPAAVEVLEDKKVVLSGEALAEHPPTPPAAGSTFNFDIQAPDGGEKLVKIELVNSWDHDLAFVFVKVEGQVEGTAIQSQAPATSPPSLNTSTPSPSAQSGNSTGSNRRLLGLEELSAPQGWEWTPEVRGVAVAKKVFVVGELLSSLTPPPRNPLLAARFPPRRRKGSVSSSALWQRKASAPQPSLRQNQVPTLNWYLNRGGAPDLSASPPVYLHGVEGNGAITMLKPTNENQDTEYSMLLKTVPMSPYNASVTVQARSATSMPDGAEVVLNVEAGVPTYLTSDLEASRTSGSLVILQAEMTDVTGNTLTLWVNFNDLATATKHMQAPIYEDSAARYTDGFAVVSLILPEVGHRFVTWTIQSSLATQWTLKALRVKATEIIHEMSRNFNIPKNVGFELFSFTPTPGVGGQLFIQIMPANTQESIEAYPRWQDLREAVDMAAASIVNGVVQYHDIIEWGYTSDGTAGLQVQVNEWDKESTVYIIVQMKPGAKENSFSLAVYHMSSAFQAWKWWVGGIIFSVFVFCVARCVLCRTRHQQGVFIVRNVFANPRHPATMGAGGLQPPPVEVTTTEPIPTTLVRVANTLYKRKERGEAEGADGCQDQVNGVLVIHVGGENASATNPSAPQPPVERAGSADDDDCDACIVCLDKRPDAVLLECGHGGLCVACGDSLWKLGPARRQCPMCRKVFTGVMKIVKEEGNELTVEPVHYAMAPQTEPAIHVDEGDQGPNSSRSAWFLDLPSAWARRRPEGPPDPSGAGEAPGTAAAAAAQPLSHSTTPSAAAPRPVEVEGTEQRRVRGAEGQGAEGQGAEGQGAEAPAPGGQGARRSPSGRRSRSRRS